jgi:hypothetical protein
MTTKEAIDSIVAVNTLPPQIDFTPPGMVRAERAANEHLMGLPDADKDKAWDDINDRINAYFEPDIEGTDGNIYSAAELNAMF